jgi:hypothetical protein
MRLTIDIPDREIAIAKSCPVPLAIKGVTWKESCLGDHAKETGVYLIHHGGDIKYVRQTVSGRSSLTKKGSRCSGGRWESKLRESSSDGLSEVGASKVRVMALSNPRVFVS